MQDMSPGERSQDERIAVVLFNLGGPDGPDSVEPFLYNLFKDPAIIGLPGWLRIPLARLIAKRRAPIAREIYKELGGGSPLLANTKVQAEALERALRETGSVKVFLSMRYWHPMSDETAREVAAYAPSRIVLLPLYPQFSTTTSASSLEDWRRATRGLRLTAASTAICCYPRLSGLIEENAALIAPHLVEAGQSGPLRLLFSAHGLPKKVVEKGDPYQWQVETTAAAIIEHLRVKRDVGAIDWRICYQSRVGPLEWIGPSTEAEIERAGQDGVAVVLVPIAFVSEHSETLVELDIEYRKLAEEMGVPRYLRVPTVDAGAHFIDGLASLVRQALDSEANILSGEIARICPAAWGRCPLAERQEKRG